MDKDVTLTPSLTTTLHVALKLVPSLVTALITHSPTPIAVTLPSWSTLATKSLDEENVTVLLSAFVGKTVAVNVEVEFLIKSKDKKMKIELSIQHKQAEELNIHI